MAKVCVKTLVAAAAAAAAVLLAAQPGFSVDLFSITEAEPPRFTDEGLLFTYKPDEWSPEPRYVMVSGDFDNWRQPYLMSRNENGVFLFLFNETGDQGVLLEEGRYRYRLLIDGIWVADPGNRKVTFDKNGVALSYFDVERPVYSDDLLDKNPWQIDDNTYVFYYPQPVERYVRLVGDFNNFDPYSLPLNLNDAGIWEIRVNIPPGRHIYRFYVDGTFQTDPLNDNIEVDRFDNRYNVIDLPLR
jgi:1,4-alpha-glucan branching enzyme